MSLRGGLTGVGALTVLYFASFRKPSQRGPLNDLAPKHNYNKYLLEGIKKIVIKIYNCISRTLKSKGETKR